MRTFAGEKRRAVENLNRAEEQHTTLMEQIKDKEYAVENLREKKARAWNDERS